MADWMTCAAKTLAGGHEDRCEAGHGRQHYRTLQKVTLGARVLPDCPAAPQTLSWMMHTFAADEYRGIVGYCPADDEVSRGIAANGVWEPWESALVVAILADVEVPSSAVFVDFGAHVGWYTLLAAVMGYQVLAVDSDPELVEMIEMSCSLNSVADDVTAVRGWVDATKAPLPVGQAVRLAKIDVEGADHEATRMLGPLLADGNVDYVLVELSPEFGTAWLSVVGDLSDAGLEGFLVPTKGDDVAAYEADPLGETLRRPLRVADVDRQCSVLFTRPS